MTCPYCKAEGWSTVPLKVYDGTKLTMIGHEFGWCKKNENHPINAESIDKDGKVFKWIKDDDTFGHWELSTETRRKDCPSCLGSTFESRGILDTLFGLKKQECWYCRGKGYVANI